jgi:hypothetical protein
MWELQKNIRTDGMFASIIKSKELFFFLDLIVSGAQSAARTFVGTLSPALLTKLLLVG